MGLIYRIIPNIEELGSFLKFVRKTHDDERSGLVLHNIDSVPKRFPCLVTHFVDYTSARQRGDGSHEFDKTVHYVSVSKNLAKCLVYPQTNKVPQSYANRVINPWFTHIFSTSGGLRGYKRAKLNEFSDWLLESSPIIGGEIDENAVPCLITAHLYKTYHPRYKSLDNPFGLTYISRFIQLRIDIAKRLVYFKKEQN